MARLADCRKIETTRKHVTIGVTVNLQRVLAGAKADEASPEFTKKFAADMEKLCTFLVGEVEHIIETAETTARECDEVLDGEIVPSHHDCRNPTIDSEGSKAYARVEITSTCKVDHFVLMELVEAILAGFREYIFMYVLDAANEAAQLVDERPAVPAIELGALAVGARAAFAALSGSDEPQLGDRA